MRKSHLIQQIGTKQVSSSSDHEAALLQMHQLRSDVEASNSQALEKEETARKEIEELKLQIQELLLARENDEKNVSANCETTLFALFRKISRCARDLNSGMPW